MRSYQCVVCGFTYDEFAGSPDNGISPGVKWDKLPEVFRCPTCAASKSAFRMLERFGAGTVTTVTSDDSNELCVRELSAGVVSAICSNLAKGCEKQRLSAEAGAFNKLAEYYKTKNTAETGKTLDNSAEMLESDLSSGYAAANGAAITAADRGALRSLAWSEKVSMMLKSLLDRFDTEGESMLVSTKIFVCDICGFIYIGETPPEICPVCKVPGHKITEVERG